MWREETGGQGKAAEVGITVRFDIMYWANLAKDFSGSYWAWCRECDVTSWIHKGWNYPEPKIKIGR